jgi:hypothetical protein
MYGAVKHYPRSCYFPNEIATRNAMREYNEKKRIWYQELERLCPNYYQLNLKERIPIRAKVDEIVGFHLEY